ncbi:MAG TPA: MTH938/NDUFAF3 family protein [Steroidobacteraceae bacterium]
MKFTLDSGSGANLIKSYSPAGIRIGEQWLTHTLIVTADRLISDAAPASFAELAPQHLPVLFELSAEVVIVGTGTTQQFAPAAVRAVFAARRVGLEVMELGAACRTYNVLVQEQRRVAALLFLR